MKLEQFEKNLSLRRVLDTALFHCEERLKTYELEVRLQEETSAFNNLKKYKYIKVVDLDVDRSNFDDDTTIVSDSAMYMNLNKCDVEDLVGVLDTNQLDIDQCDRVLQTLLFGEIKYFLY